MPILGIGFIGGVIYHATRSDRLWLLLDFMPILILVLAASIYLWQMLLNNTLLTFICTLSPILIYRLLSVFVEFPDAVYISMGYTVLALNILLPAVFHCIMKNPASWKSLLLSGASFGLAIFFRQIDITWGKMLLPIGTHFLWHIFGGTSTFFLIKYLYESDNLIKKGSRESSIKKALTKFFSE
jgi:hemolysin III